VCVEERERERERGYPAGVVEVSLVYIVSVLEWVRVCEDECVCVLKGGRERERAHVQD